MSISKWRLSFLAALFCTLSSAAFGANVNIDFHNGGAPLYTGLAAAPDGQGGAAMWNGVNPTGLTEGLIDSAGGASAVSIDITGGSGTYQNVQEMQGGYIGLMGDYAFGRSANPATQGVYPVVIGGLVPGESYDLYFYGQGDNVAQNAGFRIGDEVRQTSYDGVYDSVNSASGDGLLVEDVEYVKFTSIAASLLGEISFDFFNPTANGLADTSTGVSDVQADENGQVVNPNGGALVNAYDRHVGFNGLQIVGAIPPPSVPLNLQINTITGEVALQNPNAISVAIDDYSITTDQNTLDPDSWSPLADEGGSTSGDFNGDSQVDATDYALWRENLGAGDESSLNGNGDGSGAVDTGDFDLWVANYGASGSGWAAAGAAHANYLGEFYLGTSAADAAAIAPGASLSLGSAFDTSVLGAGVSDGNLVFEYFGAGGASIAGTVSFVTAGATSTPEPASGVIAVLLLGAVAAARSRRTI